MSPDELVKCKPETSGLIPAPARALVCAENPVRRTVWLIKKHVWLIVACVGISLFVCLLYSITQPRLYRATAKIAIYREGEANASLSKLYSEATGDPDDYSVSLETQLHILQSRTLSLAVVRKLGLDSNFEFLRDAKPSIVAQEGRLAAAVDVLLRGLSVIPVKQTRAVAVSFTGRVPELDAAIVNMLIDEFIDDSIRSRYETATRSAKFLSGQLADLRTKVEQSQQTLVQYEREHNIIGIDEKQNVVTAKLEDLNKQLTAAQADRIDKESVYQTISAGSLDEIPAAKTNEALQTLHLKESELKNELSQTSTIYGPNHPKIVALQNRIKALNVSTLLELKRVQARAEGEFQAAERREQKLRDAFETQKGEANRLSENGIQYGLLKREFESNRQLYDNVDERMKQAGVSAGLRSSNIRLIDAAEKPVLADSPNLSKSGSLGLFLGFIASLAAVGIRESMDRRFDTTAEVELFTSMPSLAIVPRDRMNSQKGTTIADEPVCICQPHSAISEAYRALGTSIMRVSPHLKVLLICSPLPGEGKTVTTANIAVVLAQQGKRVLLVDADLRKPGLHRHFGMANETGLSNLLSSKADEQPCVGECRQAPNLSILTAGPSDALPAEMLGSTRMQHLISTFRETYDYVIVDTPPLLAVTDAVRLSAQADSVLLVIRSGQTTREALSRACDVLNQASVPTLGIVINDVSRRSAGGYYYGYDPQLAETYYTTQA